MHCIRYLLAATLFVGGCKANSQGNAPAKWADTIASEIEKAQMTGDLAKLQAARAMAERVATAYPDDGLILHYQAFATYREAMQTLGLSGGDPSAMLEIARAIFERSLKKRPLAETHILMASIDGQ